MRGSNSNDDRLRQANVQHNMRIRRRQQHGACKNVLIIMMAAIMMTEVGNILVYVTTRAY